MPLVKENLSAEAEQKKLLLNSNQASLTTSVQAREGLLSIWDHRGLIGIMAKRDSLGKYKGSLLGVLWPMINPVGHLILYTFLFCIILKVKLGGDGSTSNFALYLMAGLLPWGAFSEAVSRSSVCILEHPNYVKRVVFPLQVLPVITVLSTLVTEAMAFVILIAGVALFTHQIHATLLYLPLVCLSQLLLTTGLCWFLASLGVYIRDIRHMMALMLAAWMYATPIVYPATSLPANFQFLLWLNPMAGIVLDYRRVVLEGVAPNWQHYGTYTAVALVAFFLGFKFFEKTKKSFADVM
ncbi:MAG: ABC transporter permease [Cyanobacteria bacterium SZAS LIN-2]|nr:ABC transporter permease [Cyanobacteria bacterium SZAS LIN-2]